MPNTAFVNAELMSTVYDVECGLRDALADPDHAKSILQQAFSKASDTPEALHLVFTAVNSLRRRYQEEISWPVSAAG